MLKFMFMFIWEGVKYSSFNLTQYIFSHNIHNRRPIYLNVRARYGSPVISLNLSHVVAFPCPWYTQNCIKFDCALYHKITKPMLIQNDTAPGYDHKPS